MPLVIVESPAKAKTIERYLGSDFKVKATLGHIMDLPKSGLGVNVEKKYEPEYQVMPGKKKTVSDLRKFVAQNDQEVYLALDPDREGEAIAAHVAEVFKLKKPKRIVFHEITKPAILEAIKSPREISEGLVDAQKARRVLDRLIGYPLSELLWKKIWYGLSAGRVQSVATRLIVERERERLAFKPEEFWKLFADLTKQDSKEEFRVSLKAFEGKTLVPKSQKQIDGILSDLDGAKWIVEGVERQQKTQHALPPFITSTLQRLANSYLGYSTKRTMQLAQQLYQGIDIKGKGHVGLITYMRTDSTNLSNQAIDQMRGLISKKYGDKYLPEKPNFYKTKSRMAQEAHEAIRPTDFELSPSEVKDHISPELYKLYKLIWDRTVGCQMKPMEYFAIEAKIAAKCKNGKEYQFAITGSEVIFDGFAKATGSSLLNVEQGTQKVPALEAGEELHLVKLTPEQCFTKPKPRYTEASLVKILEKYGIGRPSTYATIITTIQSRGYVGREGKYLFPTDTGTVVTDFLIKHFPDIVDYDFTSEIEEELDDIAENKLEWVPVVDKVYKPFAKALVQKDKEVKKEDVVILGDSKFKCPVCKGKMVERLGRNGRFLSCADFPKCKGMLGMDGKTLQEEFDSEKYEGAPECPDCGGKMVLKSGRFGKFWACTDYPKCKGTAPLVLKEKCPECGKGLVERKGKWGKGFIGCSGYPACKYIKKEKKEEAEENEK